MIFSYNKYHLAVFIISVKYEITHRNSDFSANDPGFHIINDNSLVLMPQHTCRHVKLNCRTAL